MKKIVSLCLLLALTAALFSGCHGKVEREEFQVPETLDTSRQFEITFWAKNDSNKNQVAVYKQAIADFEALYPNVKVKLKLYTNYARIYQDVITNIATDTTPNVCITYPDHIATYLTGDNCVAPLDELFTHEKYGLGGSEVKFDGVTREEIVPKFLEEGAFGGSYYAIPYMRSTEACYINKTYVEKLGYQIPEVLTWDFIWEVSEAAMKKDAEGNFIVNGKKALVPFLYKSTDNMMIQMLAQKGAGYSDDSGNIQIFNETTGELLKTIGKYADSGAFSTFNISGYPANYLNRGECIFAIDSTAGATWMGSDAPLVDIPEEDVEQFETVVMPLPQFGDGQTKMISQGPSICVFNKEDPQEVLVSWLFAQSLLTDSVQIGYAKTEGYVPVTTRAQQSQAYQDYLSRAGEDTTEHYSVKMDATRLLLDNIDNTFVTPVFNGSASLRNAAGELIETVVREMRNPQGADTVSDAYLQELYGNIRSLYRLDQTGEIGKTPGKLPAESVILLCSIAGAWVLMGVYVLWQWRKNKKVKKY